MILLLIIVLTVHSTNGINSERKRDKHYRVIDIL